MGTLFQGIVPPVLCFALGSLGFLTPFPFSSFEKTLAEVINGTCSVTMRMRLQCDIMYVPASSPLTCARKKKGAGGALESLGSFHILNEVVLDRGPTPYVTRLEVLLRGSRCGRERERERG
jgi:NAD+ kinase